MPTPKDWQLKEIRKALTEAKNGQVVKHETVVEWLKSWGKPNERKAPTFRKQMGTLRGRVRDFAN